MIRKFLLATFAFGSFAAFAATAPSYPPALKFKTVAGAEELEKNRKITFYLKTSVPDAKFYVQYGNDTEVQEVSLPNANSAYTVTKTGITETDMEVKVWAPTISFLNCASCKIYEMQILEDGKKIQELRTAGNQISDWNFISAIDSLTYIVTGTNTAMKSLTLSNPKLQRVDITSAPALEELKVTSPTIYEFSLASAPYVKNLDLSACDALKTLTVKSVPDCKSVTFGKAELLEKIYFYKSFSDWDMLQMSDKPALKEIYLSTCDNIRGMSLSNLPVLNKITLNNTGIVTLEMNGIPSLTTLSIPSSKVMTSAKISDSPKLATITIASSPLFNSLTLDSGLDALATLTLNKCGFKSYTVPDIPTLKKFTITDNPELSSLKFNCTSLTEISFDNCPLMTSVDISKQTVLNRFSCIQCNLSGIKYDHATWPNVTMLNVKNNNLAFSEIPFRIPKYNELVNFYAPQVQPSCNEVTYVGQKIDFSRWATATAANDSVVKTDFKWYTKFEEELRPDIDFKENPAGVFTFIRAVEDSVRCEMSTEAFPEFHLHKDKDGNLVHDDRVLTNWFSIEDAPAIEFVDLGLPSGTLWANRNCGAITEDASGKYVAWGETEEKTDYSWATYKWCNGTQSRMTKYVVDSQYGEVDNKTSLDSDDDIACMLGSGISTPSTAQFAELLDTKYTTWTVDYVNGKKGARITGKNGNSIFVPACGFHTGTRTSLDNSAGCLWSRDLTTSAPQYYYNANVIRFGFDRSGGVSIAAADHNGAGFVPRNYGYNVRAVKGGTSTVNTIAEVSGKKIIRILTPQGLPTEDFTNGINIVVYSDGTTGKILK